MPGVRAIFRQWGGKPFAQKFLQVAQIFTQQSKRNEGHTTPQHRPYWHMKVARYSFSEQYLLSLSINYVATNKHLEKSPAQLYY